MSATTSVGVFFLVTLIAGFLYLAIYTDQLGPVSEYFADVGTFGAISALIPLSLANNPANGDLVCDLDIKIPTLLNNEALFGTPFIDIITDENGNKLSGERLSGFLNDNEYLYIGSQGMDQITYEWKNCFNEGSISINSIIPLFNGQIASERISVLSFMDPSLIPPTTNNPLVATGSVTKSQTQSTILTLALQGMTLENDLRLVDKNNFGVWIRNMGYEDGLNYHVTASLRYTIENAKVSDYQITLMSDSKPINEMRMSENYEFKICGIIQNQDRSLSVKTMC